MNNKEIRHLNLSKLLEKFSTKRSFADKCDLAPGHVSQMFNKTRDIGDKVAEKIELSLGLSRGWMDQLHDDKEYVTTQTLNSLMSVATETYMDTLIKIQKAQDKGILDDSDKAMLKIIADKYKDRL